MICSCGKDVRVLHPACERAQGRERRAAQGRAREENRPEKLCVVCQKKVGAWHANGVHPSCEPKMKELWKERGIGASLTQAQRDAILRGINVGRRS